jgi:HEAT repeat protein
MRASPLTFAALAAASLLTAAPACAGESSAESSRPATVADDTASLARLLNTVRGVDPLLCELATRTVDMHGSWSQWGGGGGVGAVGSDPLRTDSAASALIAWIQQDHKDPAVVPRLRAAMRDPDACVRRVGASFLARVEHPSALAALLDALGDTSADTRGVAALALGMTDKPEAMDPLIKRLKDESPVVRRAAAWALGSLEQGGAIAALIQALQTDVDPRVRQTAAWAIGNIH